MKEQINIGLIGCGCRGTDLLRDTILPMHSDGVNVIAVCDSCEERMAKAATKVEEETGIRPFLFNDYKELVAYEDIDSVVIATAWEAHVDIAIAAMKAGKYVGMEVGGAYSIDDCWRLIETYKETNSYLMLLENCCYGRRELMIQNMVRDGVFGDIIYCEGGYCHDLRSEIANGDKNGHYRLRNYLKRNCDNYPTHALGPIAKILNINRGNRFVSLVSMTSASKSLPLYIQENFEEHPQMDAEFRQGDVVNTAIRCAGGELVTLTLDTTLPRTYSRRFSVRGVKGGYFEDTDSVFEDGKHNEHEWEPSKLWGNAKEYEEKYEHELWRGYMPRGGHGGMDWLLFREFFEAVKNNTYPSIDVYDAVTWMAVTALSEESIKKGNVSIEFPDFTEGAWEKRE